MQRFGDGEGSMQSPVKVPLALESGGITHIEPEQNGPFLSQKPDSVIGVALPIGDGLRREDALPRKCRFEQVGNRRKV